MHSFSRLHVTTLIFNADVDREITRIGFSLKPERLHDPKRRTGSRYGVRGVELLFISGQKIKPFLNYLQKKVSAGWQKTLTDLHEGNQVGSRLSGIILIGNFFVLILKG